MTRIRGVFTPQPRCAQQRRAQQRRVAHRVARRALGVAVTAASLLLGQAVGPLPDANAVAAAADGAAPHVRNRAHNDVLFVGAHPDDEFQSLSTFGQWNEKRRLSVGVATITRGEGGGNAVGQEEGAALGLIREREERQAVAVARIKNVYYLDKPDFWYTLSAPLTRKVWDGPPRQADTLERLVRLIRATTPRTVVTMDPRPFNQHGAHQLSARMTIEAFHLAGDPRAFPEQVSDEGYRPWRPARLLTRNWSFEGPKGPGCATAKLRDPVTGLPQLGAWQGAWSRRNGTTWAQLERNAARLYRTQGFASLPATVTTPRKEMGCDWFSVLAERGKPQTAPVHRQQRLRPVYAEFAAWADRVGMPWLANRAQPDYPTSPSTTVPATSRPPRLDGRDSAGEYPGQAVALTHWQGDKCASEQDCSAIARMSRHGDDLYVLVEVADEAKGSALSRDDCKRHWRTDSVEIALDPRGNAQDTSTTFKAAVLPFTSDGGSCASRDADHHQGPATRTAPGMRWAAAVQAPYTGYTVEVKIALADLPAAADPAAMTGNIMVYDSDTQDRTSQSRLGWSTFGSAQADPYTWGTLHLPGYSPPTGRPTTPGPPTIPMEAARSSDSPASVAQSRRTGVPLAVGPRHPH
ncbi:PIG-L family deacetylase [Streptomyces sp. DW4-2]|uniref:PIG-L family deacetylase n=1 Tax=Streptomyces spirodelae TaxID=2812904 RepID=A0ABS3WLP6_9ACTN|nr:PIG-L family deacetylase [Streptomyces spirodelae]